MPSEYNSELRRRLQEITDMPAKQDMSVDQLEQAIADLASTHPHWIRRLPTDEARGYRCFVHAFELGDSPAYRIIADIDQATSRNVFFAGSEFARFAMESEELAGVSEGEARPSDLVVYLDDEGTPQHAGKIVSKDKRVKSKWGGGLFLEHGLWEVPEDYGNTLSFCQRIPTTSAERVFLRFVKSRDGFEEFVDKYDLRDLF